ncbi:MAG: shikimate kinase [Oscillospiraceae bacterium]|nr:shikimate kinase [Oscillospiraceae bacterium]
MSKNLILIGMPGAGKSTIGRLVAEGLGRPFADTDTAIEQAANLAIPEIFEAEGEVGFRVRETEILIELCQRNAFVIATGGGCVTRAENHQILRKNSVIVYIERPLVELSLEGRPLSHAGNLEAMYQARLPLYRQLADFTVQNNVAPEIVAAHILEVIHEAIGY